MRLAAVLLAGVLTLAGCTGPAPHVAASGPVSVAEPAPLQAEASEAIAPAVVAVQEAVQAVIPPEPAPPVEPQDRALVVCLTRLIPRWEVSGERAYTRKYQGVIWPGGSSGPTWGIGYDGGHQTRAVIRLDWPEHPGIDRLEFTAGVTGERAKARVRGGEWSGVLTPYPYASETFGKVSLPAYIAAARQAVPNFDELPVGAQCALVDNGYNRGWSLVGPRRKEIATIVRECAPAKDVACIAAQLRASCRLWAGTPNGPGLCARREDEARIALAN